MDNFGYKELLQIDFEKVWTIILILLALFLAIKFINIVSAWVTGRTVVAKVRRSGWKYFPLKGKSTYLIYTDKGVFRNEDSIAYLNFRSSDQYGMIENGKTYKFKIYGFRIPFFSDWPNVVKIRNVE